MTQAMAEQQMIHDLIEQAERGPLFWDGYDWLREQEARGEWDRERERSAGERFDDVVGRA